MRRPPKAEECLTAHPWLSHTGGSRQSPSLRKRHHARNLSRSDRQRRHDGGTLPAGSLTEQDRIARKHDLRAIFRREAQEAIGKPQVKNFAMVFPLEKLPLSSPCCQSGKRQSPKTELHQFPALKANGKDEHTRMPVVSPRKIGKRAGKTQDKDRQPEGVT